MVNEAFLEIALRGAHHVEVDPRVELWQAVNEYLGEVRKQEEVTLYPPYGWNKLHAEFCFLMLEKGITPPFSYTLNDEEMERGLQLRRSLNIPDGAETVVLHVRESGYLEGTSVDYSYHNYRDANIENYLPAIQHLIDEGYYIIRLGDRSMRRLTPHPQVIDAPFHPRYTQLFEPYFCATSHFYLGFQSGPVGIAVGFGTPVLWTNALPLSGIHGQEKDILLYKKLYSRNLKRFLTYEEIVQSHVVNYFRSEEYESNGLEPVENTSDEILHATREMLARLDGTYAHEEDSRIQAFVRTANRKAHILRQALCPSLPLFSLHFYGARVSTEYYSRQPELLGVDIPTQTLYSYYVKGQC